jgi:hypothetical protein
MIGGRYCISPICAIVQVKAEYYNWDGYSETYTRAHAPRIKFITRVYRLYCEAETHTLPLPFLGSIPMDPAIAEARDSGCVFIQHYKTTATAQLMQHIIESILTMDLRKDVEKTAVVGSTGGTGRSSENRLSTGFTG